MSDDLDGVRGLVADRIATIHDHPSPGIVFRDITPVLADPVTLAGAVDGLTAMTRDLGVQRVIAAEARGFLLGPAIARELDAGFILARKPGRLPRRTVAVDYALEYGQDRLEAHADLLDPGTRVLVHDDLLATGGTAGALCALVEALGGVVVGCSFLVELDGLGGRERLAGHDVRTLLRYADG
ncbi:MAG: adenine phosphoribosyltransferase [Solirubrobacteraceae bacterium]|nr:adenine phosphoribosyltransferase [Solirubrobacteraceae bacterium]